jgi:hypothetical protein
MPEADDNNISSEVTEMPTLAATAATRLAGSILSRLSGPHARMGGSVIHPDALWQQVGRRLGVVPEGHTSRRLTPTRPLGRAAISDEAVPDPDPFSIFGQEKSNFVWHTQVQRKKADAEERPSAVTSTRPLPRITPIPLSQTQSAQAPPAAQDIVSPLDSRPAPETAPLPAAAPPVFATPAPLPATNEVAPPVLIPARQIRVEMEPPPPIRPAEPLVLPQPLIQIPTPVAQVAAPEATFAPPTHQPKRPRPLSETVQRQLAAEVNRDMVPATDMLSRMVRNTTFEPIQGGTASNTSPIEGRAPTEAAIVDPASIETVRTMFTHRESVAASETDRSSTPTAPATVDPVLDAIARAEAPAPGAQRGPIAGFFHRITSALPQPVRQFFGGDEPSPVASEAANPAAPHVPVPLSAHQIGAPEAASSPASTVSAPISKPSYQISPPEPISPLTTLGSSHSADSPSQAPEPADSLTSTQAVEHQAPTVQRTPDALAGATVSGHAASRSGVESTAAGISGVESPRLTHEVSDPANANNRPNVESPINAGQMISTSGAPEQGSPTAEPSTRQMESNRGPQGLLSSLFNRFFGRDSEETEPSGPRKLEMPWARRQSDKGQETATTISDLPTASPAVRGSAPQPATQPREADSGTAPTPAISSEPTPGASSVPALPLPVTEARTFEPVSAEAAMADQAVPDGEHPTDIVQASASPLPPAQLDLTHVQRKSGRSQDTSDSSAPVAESSTAGYSQIAAPSQAIDTSAPQSIGEAAPEQPLPPAAPVDLPSIPAMNNQPASEAWQALWDISASLIEAHRPITSTRPITANPIQDLGAELRERYLLSEQSPTNDDSFITGEAVHTPLTGQLPMRLSRSREPQPTTTTDATADLRGFTSIQREIAQPQPSSSIAREVAEAAVATPQSQSAQSRTPLHEQIAGQHSASNRNILSAPMAAPSSPNQGETAPAQAPFASAYPELSHRAARIHQTVFDTPGQAPAPSASGGLTGASPLPMMRTVAEMSPALAAIGEQSNIVDADGSPQSFGAGETPWMESLQTLYGGSSSSDLPLAIPYGAFALPQSDSSHRDAWLADLVMPQAPEAAEGESLFESLAMPIPSIPARSGRTASYSSSFNSPTYTQPTTTTFESSSRAEAPAPIYFTDPNYNSGFSDGDDSETGAWADVIADAALDAGVATPALALAGEERGGGGSSTSQEDQRSEDAQNDAPSVEIDDLAESVYVILRRRLAIERERDFA